MRRSKALTSIPLRANISSLGLAFPKGFTRVLDALSLGNDGGSGGGDAVRSVGCDKVDRGDN